MKRQRVARGALPGMVAMALAALATGPAAAGGFMIYEIGSADVGLASAGYGARAQDASTVMTNPAGMTRLEGTQSLLGAQLLYADVRLSLDDTPRPATPTGGDGGNAVGWQPGGGAFVSYTLSPAVKLGFGLSGNFGGAAKYDDDWRGRYYVQESTLIGMSLLPSIAYRVNDKVSLGATLNAMYGMMKDRVAVNNFAPGFGDAQLEVKDNTWAFGANLGMLYELDPGTRFGLTWNSQMDLDFTAQANFTGLAPGLRAVLASRGLLDANLDLAMKVPQGVMGSMFHQIDDRWAVLGSVGWQQWSKFGRVSIGVESSKPSSLTTDLHFKDTWHAALGAQYRPNETWTYNFGVAYDSKFQDSNGVSPSMPMNDGWRFGAGFQVQPRSTFSWGVAAEYMVGGSLSVDQRSLLPVAAGGRGDLVGSYAHPQAFYVAANWNWKF